MPTRRSGEFFLFALVLLCDLARRGGSWRGAAIFLLLAASLLMYQIATAAVVIAPLVLFAVGVRGGRQLIALATVWDAAPVTFAIHTLFCSFSREATGGTNWTPPPPRQGPHSPAISTRRSAPSDTNSLMPGGRATGYAGTGHVLLGVLRGVLVGLPLRPGSLAFVDCPCCSGNSDRGGDLTPSLPPLDSVVIWAIPALIGDALRGYILSSVAVAIGVALLTGFAVRRASILAILSGDSRRRGRDLRARTACVLRKAR